MSLHPRPTNPAEMYERFFVPAIFRPLSRKVLAAAQLQPGQRLLDVACGTGVVARQAAEQVGESGKVVALDLRPGMLAVARSLPAPPGASIRWLEGDALALDLPAHSFDVVLCQQGLQFFGDRLAALSEMKRVCAPSGHILLAVWQGLERHEFFRAMAEMELRHLADFGFSMADATAPFSLGSAEELRSLCEQAGLKVLAIRQESLDVSFPAERFIENMEFAYAAVMPQFVEKPGAFDAFVVQATQDTEALRRRYQQRDRIRFPMHTHLISASP